MPERLIRIYGHGDLHFITFSCYGRLPLLGEGSARDVFLATLERMRARYRFKVTGFVVMPEHVHLLVSEPSEANPSVVMKALKQCVSRDLRVGGEDGSNTHTQRRRVGHPGEMPAFWQARFHDFNVYTSEKVDEKLNYMHANPVKRGLVERPGDWTWSSCRFYETGEQGVVRIDPV